MRHHGMCDCCLYIYVLHIHVHSFEHDLPVRTCYVWLCHDCGCVVDVSNDTIAS